MNTKVSIIVPVYNTSKYLCKCLDSLINQTVKDIEILVIDDGSKDNSAEIVKRYAEVDSRIKYYFKENGGLSSARNYGLEKAGGKYIGFVDSDDWIEEDMFQRLYEGAEKNQCDMSICGIRYVYDDGCEINQNLNIKEPAVVTGFEAFKKMLLGTEYKCHAVNKLYKKELFDNSIRFPEGKLFEDVATTYKLMLKADKVYLYDKKLYNYLQSRSGSILYNSFNQRMFNLMDYVMEIYNHLNSVGLYNAIKGEFQCFYIDNLTGVSNYLSSAYKKLNVDERKIYVNKLYSYNLHNLTNGYTKNNRISRINKIKIMLIRTNFNLYVFVNSTLKKYFGK